MSSIQERLQLKRVPLDTWNIREQLCLASAVCRSGDQNWMSVSRLLKSVGDPNRPPDWYSQKSCAAQYGALLEHVETPKRKKRNSDGAAETPQESILKRLTQERIAEIQKTVAEMTQTYQSLKSEIAEARSPSTSEERLKEMWASIEAANRARERETARRAAWLREREEKRARAERNWRPGMVTSPGGVSSPSSASPASPLLTSLLKSSPVVTTPQLISHPATVVETLSPSAGAPTLSMLLEKPSERDHKTAAIEHIKSQLVQIERQLQGNVAERQSQPSVPPLANQSVSIPTPAVDIDDIEINAEDVYAFRDVDIHIPGANTPRISEKPAPRKEDEEAPTPTTQGTSDSSENTQDDTSVKEVSTEEIINVETMDESTSQDGQEQEVTAQLTDPEPDVKLAFPEVKFPTLEIKVIQPDEQAVKEEAEEGSEPETELEVVKTPTEEEVTVAPPSAENDITINQPEPVETTEQMEVDDPEPENEEEIVTEVLNDIQDIPLPPGEPIAPPVPPVQLPLPEDDPPLPEPEVTVKEELKPEEAAEDTLPESTTVEVVKTDDTEDSSSLPLPGSEADTDDDTPMELSREEEKEGKKRRDYSRKKKPESRTCSGSESASESAPASPRPPAPPPPITAPGGTGGGASGTSTPTGEEDKQYRLWKKSIMLVHQRLCSHKYASLFLRPITDDLAPGYSVAVKKPMDLATIRKNIDNGTIRSTAQFHRDVLLMLTNALMYNSRQHRVHDMARDMLDEASREIKVLEAAHAHAGLAPRRRRRE